MMTVQEKATADSIAELKSMLLPFLNRVDSLSAKIAFLGALAGLIAGAISGAISALIVLSRFK